MALTKSIKNTATKNTATEDRDGIRAKEIGTTLPMFFSLTPELRAEILWPYSNMLFNIVTPGAMQRLVDSSDEAREFNMRLGEAALKAFNTPLIRSDGAAYMGWTAGYIALAIDSEGNVLGFDAQPAGREKFLNYQVSKVLRAAVIRDHAPEGKRDPYEEGNIKLLEGFGVDPKYQYGGAQDAVLMRVGKGERMVYVVGGATIPDKQLIINVFGTGSPENFSKLEGVAPLEGEMDALFGSLVRYYLEKPDADILPVKEPESIARIRGFLRK